MPARTALPALLSIVLVTAGCVGAPVATPDESPTSNASPSEQPSPDTETPAAVGPPTGTVEMYDGPKGAPERPATLNESSVREYVRTYEYRYAYNALWVNEHTEVTLDCRVDSVTEREWGYLAVVTCTGYSNTRVPENATETPGPHADWFTQSFRYLVSEDAVERRDAENRDPVG